MITPIHKIRFDMDREVPSIIFEADYRPTTGPLPRLEYPLIGLWVHDKVVLRALFEASVVPTHEREPILHRYEGPTIVHQGQARYRYFSVPGHAGMILTNKGFAQVGLDLLHIWASLSQLTNVEAIKAWSDAYSLIPISDSIAPEPVLTQVYDLLHNFPPITLRLFPKERSTDVPDDASRHSTL